jgi:hypothetical protein
VQKGVEPRREVESKASGPSNRSRAAPQSKPFGPCPISTSRHQVIRCCCPRRPFSGPERCSRTASLCHDACDVVMSQLTVDRPLRNQLANPCDGYDTIRTMTPQAKAFIVKISAVRPGSMPASSSENTWSLFIRCLAPPTSIISRSQICRRRSRYS